MSTDFVTAIFLGLSRLGASAGGFYLLTQNQDYWGVGLLAGAAGFQVWDAVKVDRQVKAATPPPPPQG